jgi:hypothetical protein
LGNDFLEIDIISIRNQQKETAEVPEFKISQKIPKSLENLLDFGRFIFWERPEALKTGTLN